MIKSGRRLYLPDLEALTTLDVKGFMINLIDPLGRRLCYLDTATMSSKDYQKMHSLVYMNGVAASTSNKTGSSSTESNGEKRSGATSRCIIS
jgi:hypothetical protein